MKSTLYHQVVGRAFRTPASTLKCGQEFTDVSQDEFGLINRAANDVGLMAYVTLIRNTDDQRKSDSTGLSGSSASAVACRSLSEGPGSSAWMPCSVPVSRTTLLEANIDTR